MDCFTKEGLSVYYGAVDVNSLQPVNVIFVLAGTAPGGVNNAFGEVHDHRGDGLFSVKGLLTVDGMVAD